MRKTLTMPDQVTAQTYFPVLCALAVRNAAAKPVYQRLWAQALAAHAGAPPFAALPLITRDAFEAARAGADHAQDVALIHHSTGTTGPAFFRHRTAAEVQRMTSFFTEHYRRLGLADAATGPRPMVLCEIDGYHGTRIPAPSPAFPVHGDANSAGTLAQTAATLTRRYGLAGVSDGPVAIVGTEQFLMLVTLELLRAGADPKSLPVRRLMSCGHYLSNTRRRFFQQAWGLDVEDSFSLSEVFGSARRMPGGRHRFWPMVHAEFIDPVTGQPVRSGLAELVLTELPPFVDYEPLVRYRTGDLVRVEGDDVLPALSEFTPLGRLARCVRAPDGAPLLAQYPVLDAVDHLPEIAREPSERWIEARFGPVPLGRPRIAVTQSLRSIQFDVQLSFCPTIFPEAARSVANRLNRRLRQAMTDTGGDAARGMRLRIRTTGLPVTPAALFGT
ncbi:MAG: hypothetical protein LAT81_01735 [Oceanicaulis sp.]|nr:hypothetical protein [Oceanicaulis sp.]